MFYKIQNVLKGILLLKNVEITLTSRSFFFSHYKSRVVKTINRYQNKQVATKTVELIAGVFYLLLNTKTAAVK